MRIAPLITSSHSLVPRPFPPPVFCLFFYTNLCNIYTQDEHIALTSANFTLKKIIANKIIDIIDKGFKRRKGEMVVEVLRQLVP